MDEISVVKREIQSIEWTDKIRECQESGLTVQEWCRRNGINIKTYYYHLRRTREKMIEQIPVPISTISQETYITPQPVAPEIKVSIGKAIVKIPEGMSEQTIAAVMRSLKC